MCNFKLAELQKHRGTPSGSLRWLSSDDEDGCEEATGIFKAVMSSAEQTPNVVGGFKEGSLLVGRRMRMPGSRSVAAEN